MKITTLGLGYIGLPTSILFATNGHKVTGVDINKDVVQNLKNGHIHFDEPGLDELYGKVIQNEQLVISSKPKKADVFIITVPTPNKNDKLKSCDLSYVISAIKSIIPYIEKGNLIIIESTIPPLTTEITIRNLLENEDYKIGETLFLAHCPERILPGNMINEFVQNPRIIGGVTSECTSRAVKLYKTTVKGKLLETTSSEAELSKLMENTYRDVNIALANELVKISEELQINALNVIKIANYHPRVSIHSPGPGVGGHCLAVDPYFITSVSPEQSMLIKTAREINQSMPNYIVQYVIKWMKTAHTNKITIGGLTYKGNVDDIRESPALQIYQSLSNFGFEVTAYDPYILPEVSLEEACKNSSLLLILVDHDQFKKISRQATDNMESSTIWDTKNVVRSHSGNLFTLGEFPCNDE